MAGRRMALNERARSKEMCLLAFEDSLSDAIRINVELAPLNTSAKLGDAVETYVWRGLDGAGGSFHFRSRRHSFLGRRFLDRLCFLGLRWPLRGRWPARSLGAYWRYAARIKISHGAFFFLAGAQFPSYISIQRAILKASLSLSRIPPHGFCSYVTHLSPHMNATSQ